MWWTELASSSRACQKNDTRDGTGVELGGGKSPQSVSWSVDVWKEGGEGGGRVLLVKEDLLNVKERKEERSRWRGWGDDTSIPRQRMTVEAAPPR